MIQIFPDLESLSQAAARLFVRLAQRAVERRGRFCVALSGGSTPKRAYEMLACPPLQEAVAWEWVHVFWGDERCVPPDDPRSNALMARTAFLDKVSIPPAQVHPISCPEGPAHGARDYEKLLSLFFGGRPPRFDMVLLGLGEDGHTASLFPGTDALGERERWAASVRAPGREMDRVTLTLPVIARARKLVFLVSGAAKARILREVVEGGEPAVLPAQMVRSAAGNKPVWMVDAEAASLLKR